MRKIYILTYLIMAYSISMNAQSLSRSVLCGVGVTHINNTNTLTSTFAPSCIGCGTLTGGAGILTQGFQQPEVNGDCFLVGFDYDSEVSNCGLSFNFFYTGNADITTVTFEWDFGPDAFPQTSQLPNPVGVAFSTVGQKMISLRVYDSTDCDLMASTNLTVDAVGFATNPLITDVDCKGETGGEIELEINGGNGPFSYIWSNGETSSTLSSLPAGDYDYTVTDGSGCESLNSITIAEPQDSLMVSFDVTSETCEGDLNGAVTANIIGGTGPYTIEWDNGSTAMTLSAITTGKYIITVLDQKGCSLVETVLVPEKCNPFIYNTISPNGDGVNDTWVIPDIESFPDNEVRIYNRWGEVIFEADSYLNTWTGTTTDGKPLSAGAYYYVVRLNDANDKVLSGAITIIR